MRTLTMSIDELPAAIRRQAELSPEATLRGLRMAARRAQALMVEQSAEIADTGNFAAAWDILETARGAFLLNDAPYAAPLELGRRASYPPVLPILEWLGRKRGVSTAGMAAGGSEWDLSDQAILRDRDDLEELRQAAVAIARWMGNNDMPGKHFQENARNVFNAFVQQEIERALKAAEGQAN